jgi:hypothetical protein
LLPGRRQTSGCTRSHRRSSRRWRGRWSSASVRGVN